MSLVTSKGEIRDAVRIKCAFRNIFLAGAFWLVAVAHAQAQATVEYMHTDALGSPVAITNAAGVVIERQVYEPYGGPVSHGPTDAPGFTGHVEDSTTGLTYMQQRYYDPQVGRFLSVDPVTAYSNPVGAFNRYWYANNNPYRFTDPDGRDGVDRRYGQSVGFMFRNDPEKLRIWSGGEAAATTQGSSAEQGAAEGVAFGEFIDAGDFSGEAIGGVAIKFAMAAATRGRGKGGGAEHTKGSRPSTKGKHEQGQARKQRDRGRERGDFSRAPPRKAPPGHKGPWPPRPPEPPKPPKEK